MSYQPAHFDNAEVLKVPVEDGRALYICNGVAVVNFGATGDAWHRDDLTFLVPAEGGKSALKVGKFVDSTVMLTLATIESNDDSDNIGWGVDQADSLPDERDNVRVTARTVVKGAGVNVLRVAYQVNILGS